MKKLFKADIYYLLFLCLKLLLPKAWCC